MTDEEKALWISSHELVGLLRGFRDSDVKVNVLGLLVPVSGAVYDRLADVVSIELAPSLELRMVQDADDAWRASLPPEVSGEPDPL